MTRARAPGKLVLSGAYAVLDGAPALVAAVDRYALADSARDATFVTEEVAAAIAAGTLPRAPWFDANALRTALPDGSTRKLGLGSSAAILVASFGALADDTAAALDLVAVERAALTAHRTAQGGGSGIDVVASVRGGVLGCRRGPDGTLAVRAATLPPGLVWTVFASRFSASTSELVAQVRAFRQAEPATYARLLGTTAEAAEEAAATSSNSAFIDAIRRQHRALGELGDLAGARIRTPELARLAERAEAEGAAFGPSGAGGGDVCFHVGPTGPSPGFLAAVEGAELAPLELTVGARGLHRVD